MAALEALRTPEHRFEGLAGWPYAARYADVDGLRMAYVDEGPRAAAPVLLLHGEPTWGYLWRKVIAPLVAAGHRCVAPDLIGFGRSDKPARREEHTYERHVSWIRSFVEQLDLQKATLVCHDWGGLIGLRLVAAMPDRFARVVASNTSLPTGRQRVPLVFRAWRAFAKMTPIFSASFIVRLGSTKRLPPQASAAYDAPFPDGSFKAAARQMPSLVPLGEHASSAAENRAAWEVLKRWDKPFLTAFSDRDPMTRGADRKMQRVIPGCQGQPHAVLRGAGHFLQEDAGAELADVILRFLR